jgi:hypothetical protein
MTKPTVRLHFVGGTTYDTYFSAWLWVASRRDGYRPQKYHLVQFLRPGDVIDLPIEAGGRNLTVERVEALS